MRVPIGKRAARWTDGSASEAYRGPGVAWSSVVWMLRGVAVGCTCAVVLALVGFSGRALADFMVLEGQPFSGKVVDVSGCALSSASIDWGDGTTSPGVSDGATGVEGSHTYADEGTYNATVSYLCTNFRGAQTKSFQATVQDASLTSTGRAVSGTAGQSFTAVVAHVNDTNPGGNLNDFSAQIAWGDGTTSAGSVTFAAGGGFDITSTHTYAAAGSYTVSSSVTDRGGASTTTSSMAQIVAAPAPIPRSLSAPVVSGEPRDRETLTTTTGNWSDFPTSFQYQWLRCATAAEDSCVVVPDATSSTYTAVDADVGATIRARVRATNAAGTSLPADSAPTASVQPFVIRARFTGSPNPTCTGLAVSFDASSSKTPNPPITRYRFTEAIVPDFFPHYVPRGPYVLADGANPRATQTFGYDLDVHTQVPSVPLGVYVANPRVITLTVTDGTGASASYSQKVDFVQPLSTGSRAGCPELHRRVKAGHFAAHSIKFRITKTNVTARIPCTGVAECAGTLRLLERFPASQRRSKPVVLASSNFFFVTGDHTASITSKLTRAGRRLVARSKPLTATARLTTVNAAGRTSTQSFTVTLIGKRGRA
jgi:hypothetical protein